MNQNARKFLCVSDRGDNRSHVMCSVLRDKGHDAISIGRLRTSPQTLNLLCNWAEVIILMNPNMKESIPQYQHYKTHDITVGEDVFGIVFNDSLQDLCNRGAYWMFQKMEQKMLGNDSAYKLAHDQGTYGNNWERFVSGRAGYVAPAEALRYSWAAENILGTDVLEIGSGSGYGTQYFSSIPNLNYVGIDYDSRIVAFANREHGQENVVFLTANINDYPLGNHDTIVCFEFIEHVDNGKELAQLFKNHARRVLLTTPYNEVPGKLGIHHKLHGLLPTDFPGFNYHYYNDGVLEDAPNPNAGFCLMFLDWTSPILGEFER